MALERAEPSHQQHNTKHQHHQHARRTLLAGTYMALYQLPLLDFAPKSIHLDIH